jgi:SAM-dependent methyltransferase
LSYLKTIYFRDEQGVDDYPQKLCNYLSQAIYQQSGSLDGKKILDIGSGKGNHLVGFMRNGMDAYGIDLRDECLKSAGQEFEINGCDIESEVFPYKDNMFDFVFSKSVLEHVVNADNFMSQTYRVLKPGGTVLFMVPDWKSQQNFYWDDYTHVKAWTRKGLQDAMVIHGFDDVTCKYFLQLPFVWKYPSAKYLAWVISLLPDSLKWKDSEEKNFRTWVRFSKEKMLIAVGKKIL